jgi:hypothetical protein
MQELRIDKINFSDYYANKWWAFIPVKLKYIYMYMYRVVVRVSLSGS